MSLCGQPNGAASRAAGPPSQRGVSTQRGMRAIPVSLRMPLRSCATLALARGVRKAQNQPTRADDQLARCAGTTSSFRGGASLRPVPAEVVGWESPLARASKSDDCWRRTLAIGFVGVDLQAITD